MTAKELKELGKPLGDSLSGAKTTKKGKRNTGRLGYNDQADAKNAVKILDGEDFDGSSLKASLENVAGASQSASRSSSRSSSRSPSRKHKRR